MSNNTDPKAQLPTVAADTLGVPQIEGQGAAFSEGLTMPNRDADSVPTMVPDADSVPPMVVAPVVSPVVSALALIDEGVQSKKGEWGLTQLRADNLTAMVAGYVDSGRITAEQAATAIARADSRKQLMMVVDTAADYHMHVVVAHRLVSIAVDEGSSRERVARNFKIFHAARVGEGRGDIEAQETVNPQLLAGNAQSVENSLDEYEKLSDVWTTYYGGRHMAVSFPLAIELYDAIGSIDEIEAIFKAFEEIEGTPSDTVLAHKILARIRHSGGLTCDVEEFISNQRVIYF